MMYIQSDAIAVRTGAAGLYKTSARQSSDARRWLRSLFPGVNRMGMTTVYQSALTEPLPLADHIGLTVDGKGMGVNGLGVLCKDDAGRWGLAGSGAGDGGAGFQVGLELVIDAGG